LPNTPTGMVIVMRRPIAWTPSIAWAPQRLLLARGSQAAQALPSAKYEEPPSRRAERHRECVATPDRPTSNSAWVWVCRSRHRVQREHDPIGRIWLNRDPDLAVGRRIQRVQTHDGLFDPHTTRQIAVVPRLPCALNASAVAECLPHDRCCVRREGRIDHGGAG
jgi:hypothetical protein